MTLSSRTSHSGGLVRRTGEAASDEGDQHPMTEHPQPLDAVIDEGRQLMNVAYRMLGSLVDAEDAVQETYARWYAMAPGERARSTAPAAWLTKVAGRICLDQLRSARVRRERYVGEWIPEPLPDEQRVSRRPGRPDHPGRVGEHGVPRRAGGDDPGRTRGVRAARHLPRPVRGGGRGRRSVAGRQSSAPRPPPTSPHVAGDPGPRAAERRASSGSSARPGRPRTSAPWSACSTPMPPRSPTAVAWPGRAARPPRAASRSPASSRGRRQAAGPGARGTHGQRAAGPDRQGRRRDGRRDGLRGRRRPITRIWSVRTPDKLRPWKGTSS